MRLVTWYDITFIISDMSSDIIVKNHEFVKMTFKPKCIVQMHSVLPVKLISDDLIIIEYE